MKKTTATKPSVKEASTPAHPVGLDNNFSQSRDVREDRGTRQMKTTQPSQTSRQGK
jgi:hypothetical protein